MKTKIFTFLVLFCIALGVHAQSGPVPTLSGPIQIKTYKDLVEFADKVRADNDKGKGFQAELCADITLERSWKYIGYFAGELNGNGYTIKVDPSNPPEMETSLLFGLIENAGVVKNLLVHTSGKVIIPTNLPSGILAGVSRGRIINVHVFGNISSGENQNIPIGLICGQAMYLENCYASGTISGGTAAGGLAGNLLEEGTIKKSLAECEIKNARNSGGIAGMMGDKSTIEDSYVNECKLHSQGTGTYSATVGGIVGVLYGSSVIKRCYANKTTFSADTEGLAIHKRFGNIVGVYSGKPTYYDNYYIDGTSSAYGVGYDATGTFGKKIENETEGMVKLTKEAPKKKGSFKNWDFENTWANIEGNVMPALQRVLLYNEVETNVFLVKTQSEFDKLHYFTGISGKGKTFRLANDIDFTLPLTTGKAGTWAPLGKNANDYRFEGTIDGDGHKITNLSMEYENAGDLGLVACLGVDGVIKNLTIELGEIGIKGTNGLAAFAGTNLGIISKCKLTKGTIEGNSYLGGIAGYLGEADGKVASQKGIIEECIVLNTSSGNNSSVVINGKNNAGGLAGNFRYGTIKNSYVSSVYIGVPVVSGSIIVAGGLVGYMNGDNAKIENCYSAARVELREVYTGTGIGTAPRFYDGGGIIGTYSKGTVTKSYFANGDKAVLNEQVDATKVDAQKLSDVKSSQSYGGWTFTGSSKWRISDGDCAAYLSWENDRVIRTVTVDCPEEGVDVAPGKLVYKWNGGNLDYRFTLQQGFEKHTLSVELDGEEQALDDEGNGVYSLSVPNISKNSVLKVTLTDDGGDGDGDGDGDEDVANFNPDSGVKVFTTEGMLIIETIKPMQVGVYSITGKVEQLQIVDGMRTFPLRKGIYVVRVGEVAEKVVIR